VYIEKGERIIGYDNAERKGDHRHHGQSVGRYAFEDMDRLMEDFLKDVSDWRGEDED
jgi:hypothetical protein